VPAIPIRFYIYAGIAALLGYLLWREHYLSHKLTATRAELSTATATLKAERLNTEKANAAAEKYALSLENLKAARSATPVRTVRLCNGPASVPRSATAARTDESGSAEFSPPPGSDTKDRWSDDGPDVGPYLYALADEADTCHATLEALQGWVRGR